MATMTGIRVDPVTTSVGAIIHGADLTRPLDSDALADVRKALLTYGVIFFRDQDLSDDQMGAFVSQFGEPMPEPFLSEMNPNSKPVGQSDLSRTKQSTAVWHTDTTFVPEPPGLTGLRAVQPR